MAALELNLAAANRGARAPRGGAQILQAGKVLLGDRILNTAEALNLVHSGRCTIESILGVLARGRKPDSLCVSCSKYCNKLLSGSSHGDFSYGVYIVPWLILKTLIQSGVARLNPAGFLLLSICSIDCAGFFM